MTKRIAIALALIFFLVAPTAGDASAAVKDAALFHLGKVQVVPIIGLNVGYTSNLYQEDSSDRDAAIVDDILNPDMDTDDASATDFSPDSSTVTRLSAGLNFLLPANDFTFGAGGIARWSWYTEDSDQDSLAGQVFASIGGDFPGGFSFLIKDTYEGGWLLESFEFGPGEDYILNQLNTDFSYTFHEDMRVRFQWTNYLYDYELSKERDRTENILTGTLYRRVAPKTAALVAVDYADYSYDISPELDNHSTQVSGGVTWEATRRSTGLAQAGYEWKRYDVETEQKNDGEYYTMTVGVNYRPGERTNLDLTAERRSVESSFIDNPYFVASHIRADVGYRFMRRFTVDVWGELRKDDYPNETTLLDMTRTREDDYGRVGGRLGFDILSWLNAGVEGTYTDRSSNYDFFDYQEKRVWFSVDAGLSADTFRRSRRR